MMITILAAYLHQIGPYALKLWEGGPIRWYGLSYLVGFILAYIAIRRIVVVGNTTMKPREVGDLIVALAVGAVVGGRIGYVLLYRLDLLWMISDQAPFWGVLAVNEGGMASHGGMIGVVVAATIYSQRHGHSWAHVIDLAAFATPPGLFFGRIANFINGELYGRICDDRLVWGVKFPQEMYRWAQDGDEKILKLQSSIGVFFGSQTPVSQTELITKVINEIQNNNRQIAQIIEPMLTTRHPSQIYEAMLEGPVLFVALLFIWSRKRKPLVITGSFCVIYAVLRIICELFREPDAHIANMEYAQYHITRGQLLSAITFLVGISILMFARKSRRNAIGGWRR